jgi:hypothetical protein
MDAGWVPAGLRAPRNLTKQGYRPAESGIVHCDTVLSEKLFSPTNTDLSSGLGRNRTTWGHNIKGLCLTPTLQLTT